MGEYATLLAVEVALLTLLVAGHAGVNRRVVGFRGRRLLEDTLEGFEILDTVAALPSWRADSYEALVFVPSPQSARAAAEDISGYSDADQTARS
jgi:hypothetical protein